MSTPASERTAGRSAAKAAADAAASNRPAGSGGALEEVGELGRTVIAEAVVAKVVGYAVREVSGVYAMGAGISRAIGTVRDRLPGITNAGVTQGVTVEVGERQAAVDLDIIVEYGVAIPELAAGIRRNVSNSVGQMCGLEITEVNITVGDVHVAGDEPEDTGEPRVQ